MRFVTNLMDRIFSDSTPDEFKDKVSEKIEEAKANGSSEIKDDKDHLSFTESNGDVVIEDKNHGNEVTVAKEKDGEYNLEGVPATKTQSATEPNAVSEIPEGETKPALAPNSTEDSVKVRIEEAVTDKDKAGLGKHFSLILDGFTSQDEAQQFFSDLHLEEDVISFSESELQSVADNANEVKKLAERVEGTKDPELAHELKDKAENLKAYSILAQNAGYDMTDMIDAMSAYSDYADEALTEIYSDMDVNEYFSNMTEDQIDEYFSNLDEVSQNVLFSALDDEENYTFSEVQDAIDECYSEIELDTPINEYFSDASEDEVNDFFSDLDEVEQDVLFSMLEEDDNVTFSDFNEEMNAIYTEAEVMNTPVNELFSELSDDEINSYFSELNDQEMNVVYSVFDSNEDATFSDINEALELAFTPMTEVFSDMDEDDLKLYSEQVGEEVANVAFSMAMDEDENYTYSDFMDLVEYMSTYSEEDVDQLKKNADEIGKAEKDMKATDDAELAKKVKVLADATAEEAQKAEEAGVEGAKEVKECCQSYSESADAVLEKKGIDPKSVKAEDVFDKIDANHDGKITKDELDKVDTNHDGAISREELSAATGSKSYSYLFTNETEGATRTFADREELVDKVFGTVNATQSSSSNPCFTCEF